MVLSVIIVSYNSSSFLELCLFSVTQSLCVAKIKSEIIVVDNYSSDNSCDIVKEKSNGLSKGFGFIEMPKAGEAKIAVKNLNDSMLGANKIRVKYAEDKTATHTKPTTN